ncbi:Por secretion system C-terminal sorting domain-containing protein [Aquimarina amphilecti]|uniref:Por secretion system C-terminal sorting domain-containing protein n=1 Tax=Aquimarina amphilecti TaxID=1038014 RepID=A0A1H7VB07_AQUAM|nr:T9SS type A sorting domain-containing protein [Aquimarina amphilecti]SEM06442.1 Por secretion system C-terminal sorting domain-containing protein [Aquimarina amphilecti]
MKQQTRTKRSFYYFLWCMFFMTQLSIAQNIYVSKSGNNSNDGSSPNSALRTIQNAVDKANTGNTILVEDGIYNEKISFSNKTNSNNTSNYLTLKTSGSNVIISGQGLSPNGREGLITIENSNNIKIIGFEIRDFQTNDSGQTPVGILVRGTCSNISIIDNKVHDIKHLSTCHQSSYCGVGAHGIAVYGNTQTGIKNITLENNEVYNNILQASEAFVLNANVTNFLVKGNYVHDNNNIGFDFIGYEGECDECVENDNDTDRVRNGLVTQNIAENNSCDSNPWYNLPNVPYDKRERSAGGFYVDGGTNIVFERNISRGNDLGFEFASEHNGKKTENIIMSNNVVYQNTEAGVAMGGYSSNGTGSADNIYIINNTFYKNKNDAGWGSEITFQNRVTNTRIANNIIFGSSSVGENYEGINNNGNTNITFKKNLWWGTSTSGQNNLPGNRVVVNPQFNNISEFDFSLSSDSQSINNGLSEGFITNWVDPFWDDIYPNGIPLIGLTDFNGENRTVGSVDIGAFEFMATTVSAPLAPSNLVGVSNTTNSISINWVDNADNESGYSIERSLNENSNFQEISTVNTDITSYQDENLNPNTTYYYRVRAYNDVGFSEYSNVLELTTEAVVVSLPAPWENTDVGNPLISGNASYDNGTFTVNGTGADIWGQSDQFHYVYQPLNGNGEIIAKIESVDNTNNWAKAGVMIRETLNPGSKHGMLVASYSEGIAFQRRTATGGVTTHTGAAGSPSLWLKLVRLDATLTAHQSINGNNWTKVGEDTIDMANDIYIGLATTSHNEQAICSAVFNDVQVKGTIETNVEITIDGNDTDWSSVEPISTNGAGGLTSLKAYDDKDYIYLLAQGTMNTNYIFFINTDNSTTTGYKNGLWSPEGSDYSIENGSLFQYSGSGTNWSWTLKGSSSVSVVKNANTIELRVAKSVFPNLQNAIGIGLDIENSSWNTVATLPSSGTPLAYYTLQGNINRAGIERDNVSILKGSYPNPFSGNGINIDITTDSPKENTVTIFSIQGKRLKQLEPTQISQNVYNYHWNGKNGNDTPVSPGIYLAKIKLNTTYKTIKIIKNK